jgi:hypothetical protein
MDFMQIGLVAVVAFVAGGLVSYFFSARIAADLKAEIAKLEDLLHVHGVVVKLPPPPTTAQALASHAGVMQAHAAGMAAHTKALEAAVAAVKPASTVAVPASTEATKVA